MSINSYNQTWNKLKTPSLTGGDLIDHQSLFGAGDYTHDYIDSLILGITKSYASTFPAGITLANTVALKFENAAAAADAQIVETAGNVLAVTTGSSGMTISGNVTNINGSGCGIGGIDTGFYMDGDNLAARVPNAAGNFYVQSAAGAANYVRIGQGVNGISLDTGNLKVVGATNYIGFTNDNGNTGGLVWGYEHSAYYSRIMDDGNLNILTDDTLYIGDINTSTGAKGTLPFAFDVDNGRLTITSSYASGGGNGILQVNGSTTGQTIIGVNNTSAGGHSFELYSTGSAHALGAGHFGIYDINNGFTTFRVDSSGYVHIGSRSYFYIEKTDAADNVPLHINTSTQRVTRQVSSERYKDNIQTATLDINKIDSLIVKSFDWKADNSKGLGFIAEDVAQVYPEIAMYDKDGQVENYSDRKLLAIAIEEIKDLRKRVKQLETNRG